VTVAVSVKSCLAKISRENLNVCSPQDVEKLAVADTLTVVVNLGVSRNVGLTYCINVTCE
jgi:hypothetical protein